MPTYTGTDAAETINGSSGDDVIDGRRGNDVLNGLEGADRFVFNIGGGFAEGSDESDTVDGGDGEDRFEATALDYPHYETGGGREVLPMTFSVMGGSGPGAGTAYFGMDNQGFFDGSPGAGSSRSVALRNVEVLAFDFTDSAPRPPLYVASNYYTYTTNDRFTVGDLTGTAVQRIELNFGHGSDLLDGSGATVTIVAHGEADGDMLTGGSADDQLFGDDGGDILAGGGGNNRLDGGSGRDVADYGDATTGVHVDLNDGIAGNNGFGGQDVLVDIENLTGGAFNDVLIGQGGANRLEGGDGADYLIGLAGNDVLIGGAGVDTLQGGLGDDEYQVDAVGDTTLEFAGEGRDTVRTALTAYTLRDHLEVLAYSGSGAFTGRGNGAANEIRGGGQVDTLYGLGGDDVLIGGAGSDQLYGGAGNDRLEGGAASGDTANYSTAAGGVFVTLDQAVKTATNDGDGGVDILVDIENLTGSNFNDVLIGDGQANILSGGTGADVLVGRAGDDILIGGDGAANQMQGGVGDDVYRTTAVGDTLIENAGEGYDTVETTTGAYTLKANFERLNYRGAGNFAGTGNAENNVLEGGAGNDTLNGLAGADDLIGAGGADVLNGGEGNDQLFGNDGDDVLVGGIGADRLVGDAGNDVLRGGIGDDQLFGEAGVDTADYASAAGAVTAHLALNGTATDGDGGTDSLKSIENVTGSAFNDTLVGDAGDNVLDGGLGGDLLLGYGGNDTLIGGTGAANTMQGGVGDDVYVISNAGDTAVEFANEGVDTVRTTLATYVLKANFENLTNIGNGAFTGTGNAAANVMTGGGGADVFSGLGGNDAFHGGGGVDTFVLSGAAADYAIVRLGDGTVRVTDAVAGRDGIDVLFADVERVRFGDGAILDLSTLPPAAAPLFADKDGGARHVPSESTPEILHQPWADLV